MGTKGKEIIAVDIKELVKQLDEAYADEAGQEDDFKNLLKDIKAMGK